MQPRPDRAEAAPDIDQDDNGVGELSGRLEKRYPLDVLGTRHEQEHAGEDDNP